MSKPLDRTLSLALIIRQVALFLARQIEDWAREQYGYSVGKPTEYDRG